MVGPVPVSALIHAATMVAAGVYLLFRIYEVFDPYLLDWIAFLGFLTAFLAALIATYQLDIKAVLAYSTISQLGYMVMGMGVGAYDMAMFHLWTHAFFKAGLFLCIGSVMHYLSIQVPSTDVQDARKGWIEKIFAVHILVLFGLYDVLGGFAFFFRFYIKRRYYSRYIFLGTAKRKWVGYGSSYRSFRDIFSYSLLYG